MSREALFGGPHDLARPCRSDLFFVERPAWLGAFAESFAQDLATHLAESSETTWFCPAGDPCTSNAEARHVLVTPLLPERAGAWRGDGHRRFFRVAYVGADTRRLEVRYEHLCEAVEALRVAVVAEDDPATPPEVDFPGEHIRVGRECEAIGTGLGELVTDDALQWHLGRIGAAAGGGDGAGVHIALLDAGLAAEHQAALGVDEQVEVSGGAFGIAAPSVTFHPHGAAMAAYLRQLAPAATLTSYRVLDADGLASVGTLAAAIDHVVADGAKEPTLINVSLGVPPELSRPADLTYGSCRTVEDGVGESLRYVLDVARRLDADGTFANLVVAAAGNRGRAPDPELFAAKGVHPSPCGLASAPDGPASFLPALYGQQPSCRLDANGNLTSPIQLALAVGATDQSDQPTVLSIAGAEPEVVAPGQRVYADHPALPHEAAAVTCAGGGAPAFPMALTGTSVSAALVTGTLAAAQGELLAAGIAAPLGNLARTLYLTGVKTCRKALRGGAVRRVDAGALATGATCAALQACVATVAAADVLPRGLEGACRAQVASCSSSASPFLQSGACPTYAPVPSWPSDLLDRLECTGSDECVPVDAGCVASCSAADIDAGVCVPVVSIAPYAADRFSLGSAGPLPETGGCPDCFVLPGITSRKLVLMLNPLLKAGTTFAEPRLVVVNAQGAKVEDTPLSTYSNVNAWQPGGVVVIDDVPAVGGASGAGYSLRLESVLSVDNQSGVDVSPLAVY